MIMFAPRLPALSGLLPALALWRRRIGCWGPTGVGGGTVELAFERCQAFAAGKPQEAHAQWGLLPIRSGDVESRWHGRGSTPGAFIWVVYDPFREFS